MAQFKILSSNFHVSTMVEHGTLAFFLDGKQIISARDSIDTKEMILDKGKHEYQWQVNGKDNLTRYSIRMTSNGVSIPGTGVGRRTLKGGDTDFSGGDFQIS
ncbi:hypothetical protein [Dyadobacter sp. Leaf189]|uniref:hypothetical protein n=1 Tax=Dyadobacter sp. Leaf189 TaxID=1736295 RepID=UPI0006F58AA9|nr:hypothetical protein [Dyadobacter sp. Leaf189]KQS31031.1 hypothetical protein ASG33_11770 [Dyadobacter sp. Leaf189]